MNAFLALLYREGLRFYRQKSRVLSTLLTPLIFWMLLGAGFERMTVSSSETIYQFLFAGSLSLAALFTAIFSTISVIEDRNEGFLQAALHSPTSPLIIIFSKIIGNSFIGLFQCLFLVALYFSFYGFISGPSFFVLISSLFLISVAYGALGFFWAWRLNSVQGYHGIMNSVLFPLWLLSGALTPAETSNSWIQLITKMNPLSYSLNLIRCSLADRPTLLLDWIVTLAFGAFWTWLSVKQLKPKKSA